MPMRKLEMSGRREWPWHAYAARGTGWGQGTQVRPRLLNAHPLGPWPQKKNNSRVAVGVRGYESQPRVPASVPGPPRRSVRRRFCRYLCGRSP